MDLRFTEDQDALRGLAAQILGEQVTDERLKQADAEPDRLDRALWADLARAGLLGVAIPEDLGGLGGGMQELCVLLEEAGMRAAPAPLVSVLAMGALPIARWGDASLRDELLPAIARGDGFVTGAYAEPQGDPLQPTTRAHSTGDGWTLEGVKWAVPSAGLASHLVVGADAGLFLVETGAPGVQVTPQAVATAEPWAEVRLDGARGQLLAEGSEAVRWAVEHATVALCALQVGMAERAMRLTAEYTSGRLQFERPLGSFQAVQQRAADAYIDVQAMRWTMWRAAWLLTEGLSASEEVAVAKFWAAEAGQRVLASAQHLHGGIGVDVDYPLHRFTLGAKQVELSLGGAAQQLARLGSLMAEAGR